MEPKIIGEYYVWDAELLDGWNNEKLADALENPLAELGLKVEIKNTLNNFYIYDEVYNQESESYKFPWEIEAIELQAERIISKIIQNAPEEK
jgi:hypothetical protein